jgi:predicted RNA-binding Zn ribbon-like protein
MTYSGAVRTDAPLMGEPLPVELMNTIWADRDGVHDSLADAAGTRDWLASVSDRVDVSDLDSALAAEIPESSAKSLRQLRDSLRRLAAEVTGDERSAAQSEVQVLDTAVSNVNRAARSAPSWPALTVVPSRGWARTVESGHGSLAAVVATVAAQGVDLFAGAGRGDLRACQAPGCVLYFVKQHPRREWCSAACGNRARVARHYRRHSGS